MTRWIIENRIEDPTDLKEFAAHRYTFQPSLSDDRQLVFTRTFEPAGR